MNVNNVIVGWFVSFECNDEGGKFAGVAQVMDKDVANDTVTVKMPRNDRIIPSSSIIKMGPTILALISEQGFNDFLNNNEPDAIIEEENGYCS